MDGAENSRWDLTLDKQSEGSWFGNQMNNLIINNDELCLPIYLLINLRLSPNRERENFIFSCSSLDSETFARMYAIPNWLSATRYTLG